MLRIVGIWLIVLFANGNGVVQAQMVSANPHASKLPDGYYMSNEFSIHEGDTVFRKFTRYAYRLDGTDTILFIEDFNVRKNWIVSRMVVRGNERALSGWQQEYEVNGLLEYERFCDTVSGRCDIYYHYNYYPNGHLMAKLHFSHNRLDGQSYFYYNDGTLKNHLEYHRNKLWNIHAYCDQQGRILDPGDFCNGTGVVNVYAANGVLLKQKIYKDGKVKRVHKVK